MLSYRAGKLPDVASKDACIRRYVRVKWAHAYFTIDALTPVELFHYVRAAQRLEAWAGDLREAAVGRYCTERPTPGDAI